MRNFSPSEVYQIYDHISGMCGHPDPAQACRLVIGFCKKEMDKLNTPPTVGEDVPLELPDMDDCKLTSCIDLFGGVCPHFDKCKKRQLPF